ncbi:MAG: hypothetical protein KDH09_14745, partial [Chrysiogenetes bacterium]|nr:hypothetical protein [Chrysiogenetes bacterium]
MKSVSLRRWMVCAALGLIAMVTTGCSKSEQIVQSELTISADALKAIMIGQESDYYDLLLVRLEAYNVRMESEGPESDPFPVDYGSEDKRPVATTEILGTAFMKQLEACGPFDFDCTVVVPFLVPNTTPLEIRAYVFWTNNVDIEGGDPYYSPPFVLTTELMFGSTLYRGSNSDSMSPPVNSQGKGTSSSSADVGDVGIQLAWWDSYMEQLPPPAGYGEFGNGPGYAPMTGNVTVASGDGCAVPGSPITGDAATVIAWDSIFGVPYVGTNTAAVNCGSAGCYSLGAGSPYWGPPANRRVDIFGVYTGVGVSDYGPVDAFGYSMVNGQNLEVSGSFDDTWFFGIPFIGQQGLEQGIYVNTTASGMPNTQDLELNGCARNARLTMNFSEEVFTTPANSDGTATTSTMHPLGLPSLLGEALVQTAEYGETMAVGNRAVSYVVDSNGSYQQTSAGGLILTGQSMNALFSSSGGGLGGRGLLPTEPPAFPTVWNTVSVPTFGIPYPGGALWQKSSVNIINLYDPNDPCKVMNFDFTPCYFSGPVTNQAYYDSYYEQDVVPSQICDPEDPEYPEYCYPLPAVEVDNVPLNPNALTNVANVKVRRFNKPMSCAIDESGDMRVEHPYLYGSPGTFRLAGMKVGQAAASARGGESPYCETADWNFSNFDVGYTKKWREKNHWICDPFYFVGSGGSINPGDSFLLSAAGGLDYYDPYNSPGWTWGSTPVNMTCDNAVEGVLIGGADNASAFEPLVAIDPYFADSSGTYGLYTLGSSSGVGFSGIAIDPNDADSGQLVGTTRPYNCTVYATELYAGSSAGMRKLDLDDGYQYASDYPIDDGQGTQFGDITDLTFDPNSNELLALQGGALYDIDPTDVSASLRGAAPVGDMGDVLAMTPDGSTLYTVLASDETVDAGGDLA